MFLVQITCSYLNHPYVVLGALFCETMCALVLSWILFHFIWLINFNCVSFYFLNFVHVVKVMWIHECHKILVVQLFNFIFFLLCPTTTKNWEKCLMKLQWFGILCDFNFLYLSSFNFYYTIQKFLRVRFPLYLEIIIILFQFHRFPSLCSLLIFGTGWKIYCKLYTHSNGVKFYMWELQYVDDLLLKRHIEIQSTEKW